MHIKAVEAHMKKAGGLPLNIRFFIEGEEEVGSVHLDDFVRSHSQRSTPASRSCSVRRPSCGVPSWTGTGRMGLSPASSASA